MVFERVPHSPTSQPPMINLPGGHAQVRATSFWILHAEKSDRRRIHRCKVAYPSTMVPACNV